MPPNRGGDRQNEELPKRKHKHEHLLVLLCKLLVLPKPRQQNEGEQTASPIQRVFFQAPRRKKRCCHLFRNQGWACWPFTSGSWRASITSELQTVSPFSSFSSSWLTHQWEQIPWQLVGTFNLASCNLTVRRCWCLCYGVRHVVEGIGTTDQPVSPIGTNNDLGSSSPKAVVCCKEALKDAFPKQNCPQMNCRRSFWPALEKIGNVLGKGRNHHAAIQGARWNLQIWPVSTQSLIKTCQGLENRCRPRA